MSNLELGLWVLGLTLLVAAVMGPGMWSEKWGWKTLERIAGKKPPSDKDSPSR
jgi:hypothetical protein